MTPLPAAAVSNEAIARPTRVRVKHRLWKTLLRGLPLAFLAVVLWREKPWMVRLSTTAPWAVAAAVALNFAAYLPLKAARWRVALDHPPPFRKILAATIEGLLANAALGFGSGDVVRAARLRRGEPAPSTARDGGQLAIDYGCTWAERGAEVLALAVLVVGSTLATNIRAPGATGHVTLPLVLSSLAVAAYLALLGAGRAFLLPRLCRFEHVARWPLVTKAIVSGLQASTPRRVASMAALSLLGWAGEIAMLMLFQGAFSIAPSFHTALLTLVGINAAIAIPAVPGSFGTFEAGATMALVICGVPRDVAVSYALSYHLAHVVPVAVAATLVYLVRSRAPYGLRR